MSSRRPEPDIAGALDELEAQLEAEQAADREVDFQATALREATRSGDRPGVTVRDGITEITSRPLTAILHPETLLRQHGMTPDEWEILEVKTGAWDAAAKDKDGGDWMHTDLHQIRVRVRPKKAPLWIVPASGASPVKAIKPRVPVAGKTRLTLVTTDLQVPFHDPKLHELSLRFAELVQPDEWADLGDVLDLPMLSRHRKKPEFHTTFQESVNAGGRVFAERDQVMPGKPKRVLWGNHDTRLRNWMLDHAPELFGVTRAQIGFEDDGQAVMDLDHLLRLDQSGWEKARSPWGEYPYECIWLAPGFAGIHGEHVRKGAGNSVREELRERDHSVAQGHVNKLACYAYTRTGTQGKFTVWGVEGGMMCLLNGSLGFGGQTVDWTRGWFTVTTFPDGSFNVDLASYVGGAVRWRGVRLWHDERGLVKIES